MDGYSKDQNYFDTTLDYEFSHLENRNKLIQKNISEIAKNLKISFITSTIYEANK